MRWIIIGILLVSSQSTFAQPAPFIPDFATVQYAGSIGFISAGVGYDVFRRHSFSVHYGYVPANKGGELNILATKLLFNIWSFNASPRIKIDAFSAGVMVSYHLGSEFRSRWPSHRYPDGYYWWKTSLRPHLIAQTSVTYQLRHHAFKSISAFAEINTNDLYLISLIKNTHALRPTDVFKVGYGLRARF